MKLFTQLIEGPDEKKLRRQKFLLYIVEEYR